MLLFSIRSNIEKGSRSFFSLRAKAYFNDQKNELNEIVGKEVTISVENSSRVSKSPRFFPWHCLCCKARRPESDEFS